MVHEKSLDSFNSKNNETNSKLLTDTKMFDEQETVLITQGRKTREALESNTNRLAELEVILKERTPVYEQHQKDTEEHEGRARNDLK